MAYTWSEIETDSETINQFVITRKTWVTRAQNGYLMRLDRQIYNSNGILLTAVNQLVFIQSALIPTAIVWTQESEQTIDSSFGGYDFSLRTRTYSGAADRGHDRFFMSEGTNFLDGTPTALINASIEVTAVTLDQIMYGA
jgi:hypothetical protein